MINRRLLLLNAVAAAVTRAPAAPPRPVTGYQLDLARFPGVSDGNYRADPYLAAANELQALGRQGAVQQLRSEARRLEAARHPLLAQNEALIILCRMLFAPRPERKFHRPELGGAVFLGGTSYPDWPLEPIALVDGIPFLVVQGYRLSGRAERGSEYLAYCLEGCVSSHVPYRSRTAPEKQAALSALLSSPKWNRPLERWERHFLTKQIQ